MAIRYANDETFDELILEDFVIVDFYSTACVPCRMFSKILQDLVDEIPFVSIIKVNTTDYPELAERFAIQTVPTVHFYKNGQMTEERVGVIRLDELKNIISRYLYE